MTPDKYFRKVGVVTVTSLDTLQNFDVAVTDSRRLTVSSDTYLRFYLVKIFPAFTLFKCVH